MALAMTGRDMTEDEVENFMHNTMRLYGEMMSGEPDGHRRAGDAAYPIDGVE